MTNWKVYRITSVRKESSWSANWIEFKLDDYVSYEKSNQNHIYCKNYSPFNGWREGDYIEIDNDVTYYRSSNYDFASASEVRFSSREYKDLKENYSSLKTQKDNLQIELNEQKRINSGLVSMLNNFSEQMIDERFTNSSYFTEYDLDNCKLKLKKIVDRTGKKDEEQLVLVTKTSTDLSVTKESLRLTQVANLALQQQVQEKNRLINAGSITLQTTQTQLTTAQNQNRQKDAEVTRLNNDLTTTRNQVGQLNTQIVTKDNQITQVTNERNTANEQLTLTRGQIEDLRTLFNNLKITNNNKEQAIKQKEEVLRTKEKEIIELRSQLGLLSPEEVLKNKINLKKRELDSIVRGLSLNRQSVVSLCDAYERLGLARLNYNQENITSAKNDIKNIEEEFFSAINGNDDRLYEVYQSCEQVTELNIELEKFYQQQFEARQEVTTNQ